VLFFILTSLNLTAQNSYWELNKEDKIANKSFNNDSYKLFTLDINALKSELKKGVSSKSSSVISFPNQHGELEIFSVVETEVLSPELAKKYPNIKTYRGFGIDNPGSRIRFSVIPQGVQTMTTYLDKPTVFTVPREKNTTTYISYDKGVRNVQVESFECLTEDILKNNGSGRDLSSRSADDQLLRTFRIAVSAAGEYTNRWDDGNDANGTAIDDAYGQIVSSINRVNDVYSVDMAIRFQLVSGTEIVFGNPISDPYTTDERTEWNDELQRTLTDNIGEANYDIGHLFQLSSGGYAGNAGCIGCVCEDGSKGSGYSSHNFAGIDGAPYMTDIFDLDLLPHEMGHQMGANHTWSFANEGTGVNVEPGRGSTLMGYAGSSNDDIVSRSDPYFHYVSIDQVLNNITSDPNNCWTSVQIPNTPPIANAGDNYFIPIGTAFVLKGSVTAASNSNLSYTWEQVDNGVTTSESFGPTKDDGAIFRSRPPTASLDRYMPNLFRVVGGNLIENDPVANDFSWETVSTVERVLNFAFTVRDQATGKGKYPQNSSDLMWVSVNDDAGPFVVTSQASVETWVKDETKTVTWDVAGTDTGLVNTPTVNILLSIDGGFTYPYALASNVANSGSYDITVPEISSMETTTARVMVEGNGNIFFAINSTDFIVQSPTASLDENSLSSFSMFPNPSNGLFHLSFDTTDKNVNIQVSDLKGAVIKNSNYSNVGVRFAERVALDEISKGLYIIRITNGRNSVSKKILIE
tara:strand:+ start:24779 stop:27022 length:2244 start_codon:yes stop_codon:yes gene_type:complete